MEAVAVHCTPFPAPTNNGYPAYVTHGVLSRFEDPLCRITEMYLKLQFLKCVLCLYSILLFFISTLKASGRVISVFWWARIVTAVLERSLKPLLKSWLRAEKQNQNTTAQPQSLFFLHPKAAAAPVSRRCDRAAAGGCPAKAVPVAL